MNRSTCVLKCVFILLWLGLQFGLSACQPHAPAQLEAGEPTTSGQPDADGTEFGFLRPGSEAAPNLASGTAPQVTGNQPASVQIAMAAIGYGSEEVTLAVTGSDLVNLGAYEFDFLISHGPAQISWAAIGDVLTQTGRTVGLLGPQITQGDADRPPALAIGAYSVGEQPGFSGAGHLATLILAVEQDGVSDLAIEHFLAVDPDAGVLALSVQDPQSLQTHRTAPGWNFISPCVDVSESSIAAALASITGSYDLILGQNGQYQPGGSDTLGPLSVMNGYWLRSLPSSLPLALFGNPADSSAPLALAAGWHWLGYCLNDPLALTTALASLAGRYDLVIGERGAYAPELGAVYQSLSQLHSGEGYLIHLTQSGSLVYPSGADRTEPAHSLLNGCPPVAVTPYSSLFYGTITLDGLAAPVGTVVELLTPRDEVGGCLTVGSPGSYGLALAYGEDASGGIAGFRVGDSIALRVAGCTADADLTWQSDQQPHQINFSATGSTCRAETGYKVFLPLVVR